ncbi:hypothetical protein [Bradyrhizobium sp.]
MADLAADNQTGTIEQRKDLGTGDEALYAYWTGQEKIAEREERKWIKSCRRIIQRYRDERSEATKDNNRFNVLWSNVQTLIPTLYARTPVADVERRFRDEDATGRLASELLQRCITYSADHFNFDDVMLAVTEDRLLPGRGVARVLYIPHFGDVIQSPPTSPDESDNPEFVNADEQGANVDGEGDEEEPLREVVYEEVKASYVYWHDYREGPARKWSEVPWVRYRSYLTRDELTKRFGKAKGGKVNLDFTPKGGTEKEQEHVPPDMFKKAIVDEYWDKVKKQAVWLAPGTPELVLDKQDDPLRLPGFFPNPDPCFATQTNDKRIPVPDYIEYQDQAGELDNLTARIDVLTKALKVTGFYPGENKQVLQQVFDEGMENRLVPVEDWAFFSEKGANGGIQWVPIQQVAETLIQLYNARDRVKAILYEITGIGDIMRGMTSPDETLGAQELKANFSTRRITPQQKQIARFARDLFRLMGAVVAEHFSAKTISMITGYPQLKPVPQLPPQPVMPQPQLALPAPQPAAAPAPGAVPGGAPAPGAQPAPPSPQMQAYQQQMAAWQQMAQKVQAVVNDNNAKQAEFQAAVDLIKRDSSHGFRIDIEADSTIAPDEQAEKQSRTQFMQQFVPFMETMVPIAKGNPEMAELAKEFTLFVVRGWRVARPLEETIGKAFTALAQLPPDPPPGAQKPGAQGKSPQELALEAQQTRVDAGVQTQKSNDAIQIAHEKNVTALAIAAQKSNDEREAMAAEAPIKHAELALEGARVANQQKLEEIRANTVATRGATGLQ